MLFFRNIGLALASIFAHPASTATAVVVGLSALGMTSQAAQESLSTLAQIPGLPGNAANALAHSGNVLGAVASAAMILAGAGKSFVQAPGTVLPPMPDTPTIVQVVQPVPVQAESVHSVVDVNSKTS